MRPQIILPCRPRRGDFFLQLLLAALADRGEVQGGLDVLFERRHLLAADDDGCNRLAEIELQKLSRRGAAGAAADQHALSHDFHREDAQVFLRRQRQRGLFEGRDRDHFTSGDRVGGLRRVERH